MTLQGVPYTKQILIILTILDLNGFTIGPKIKNILTFEVGAPTARHPVRCDGSNFGQNLLRMAIIVCATVSALAGLWQVQTTRNKDAKF